MTGRPKAAARSHQVGKSVKYYDYRKKALSPGRRKSITGNIYYEYRKNRTDKGGRY